MSLFLSYSFLFVILILIFFFFFEKKTAETTTGTTPASQPTQAQPQSTSQPQAQPPIHALQSRRAQSRQDLDLEIKKELEEKMKKETISMTKDISDMSDDKKSLFKEHKKQGFTLDLGLGEVTTTTTTNF